MTRNIDRRLSALEQKAEGSAETWVWVRREDGETDEQAITRAFPEGVATGTRVNFVSWVGRGDPNAAQPTTAR